VRRYIEAKTDSSFFRLEGSAELSYPCLRGERIGGWLNLKAEIGAMIIDSLSGICYFYCHVNGSETPALEADLEAEGVVQFVKGVNLKDFAMSFQAYKTGTGDGEAWVFAGSVAGTVVLSVAGSGAEHGATVDFVFDTRDGTWIAAVGRSVQVDTTKTHVKANAPTVSALETDK
jgi:hypothetical protein